MNTARIKFGTDGWRAVLAEDFTFDNVLRLAQATADYWSAHPIPATVRRAVVGFDRRFLADQFATAVAEVLAANDFHVILADQPTPTPAVSLAVRRERAVGGIMITASHNPAAFSGLKLKSHHGGSADPTLCRGVEACLDRQAPRIKPLASALRAGSIRRRDLRRPHLKAVRQRVDFAQIAASGLRFAHDAMFGVGAGCFETLLAGTSCQVTTLQGQHDPNFGGLAPEPIARNFVRTSAWLHRHPHDLCLVTDGDADRIGGLDGRGRPLSTHQLICLLLQHVVTRRAGQGRVVKALTTTSMVDKLCAAQGLELVETGVGFKYIAAEIVKGGVLLGCEESGGIAFPEHLPERDGILAGMVLLEMLAAARQPLNTLLAQLERDYGPHHYARLDTPCPLERRQTLVEFYRSHPPAQLLRSPVTAVRAFDGVKFIAANGAWLMLRGSGTEPILRIYAEAPSPREAQRLLDLGVRLTRIP